MFGMFGAFNPRFYPRIARQSIGKSIGFLVVFVLIISACVSLKYTAAVLSGFSIANKWVSQNLGAIASEYPVVSVDKGTLVEPKQAFIKEYRNVFAVIIEPNPGNVQTLMDKYPNCALLTQKQLAIKQTAGARGTAEVKTYSTENASFAITPGASGFKVDFQQRQFELTPQVIKKWLGIISMFVFPILLIIWFGVYSITKPLQVFIFSLASLIIISILKVKLPYKQLWNIGAYALVPGTCVAAFMDILGLRILFFALFYCLIYIVYLHLGIQACAAEAGQQSNG